jgi:ABC-type multidrug transport system fused ATPase/permease subunit
MTLIMEKTLSQTDFIQTLKEVFRFLWKVDKKAFFLILFTTTLFSGLSVLSNWYFSRFLNKAIYGGYTSIFSRELLFFVAILLGIRLVVSLLNIYRNHIHEFFMLAINKQIQNLMVESKARIDMETYESSGFAQFQARVEKNYGKLQVYTRQIISFLEAVLPVVISLSIILVYRWWLVFFVALPAVFSFILEIKHGESVWELENQRTEPRMKWQGLFSYFSQKNVIQEVKVHGLYETFTQKMEYYRELMDDLVRKNQTDYRKRRVVLVTINNILGFTAILVLFHDLFAGTILVGSFVFLQGRLENLESRLRESLNIVALLYRDGLFVKDVLSFTKIQPIHEDGVTKIVDFEKIEFRDVSFSYPGNTDRTILENLSFVINKGEKVAIVGVNGAGKTTLTKLLLRFYIAQKGSVYINDETIHQIQKESWYKKIGFLPQDFPNFAFTAAEAIVVGRPTYNSLDDSEINMDKVVEAAKKAGIHDFIISHPHGYDTQLGKKYENGIELSGGQWQKMALARLFYRDADLWVLDEPTSAVDTLAEIDIFTELHNLPKDKTVLLISHRFNTVKNADKILVLEDGTIKELGSHAELMKKENGRYRELFLTQKDSYID